MSRKQEDAECGVVSAGVATFRTALYTVPGLHRNAPKRNVLVVLIYVIGLSMLYGLVEPALLA